MYEIILETGIKSLVNLVVRNDKRLSELSDREQQIILEAIKTKNEMVLKRFDYALKIADEMIGLQTKLAASLVKFKEENIKHGNEDDWTIEKINSSNFLEQVHKPFFRSFLDTRNKFEPINDLFSFYSLEAQNLLSFDEMMRLSKEKFPNGTKVDGFCGFYHSIFGHVLGTLAALVRISSNDLRFWLVEKEYSDIAAKIAKVDFQTMRKALINNSEGETYKASLETQDGLDSFWTEVEKLP